MPVAIEESLAVGLAGVRGIVADRKTYRRRTLGVGLARKIGLVTFVPRPCALRQALEAWGRQQPALPLLVAKPGRTQDEAPRRWHGQSVLRPVAGAYSDGRGALEALRFVVVHSRHLAQQQTHTYTNAQAQEAEAVATHVQQVHARWFACEAAAGPRPGASMLYAIVSRPTPAPRGGRGGDVPPRQRPTDRCGFSPRGRGRGAGPS